VPKDTKGEFTAIVRYDYGFKIDVQPHEFVVK